MSKCIEEFSAETQEVAVVSFGVDHHIEQVFAGIPQKKHI